MGYETITYSCGHEGRVQLYGKMDERRRKAEWMSRTCVCDACKVQAREEESAKVAAQAQAAGLPALTGSDKQVAWAESIRAAALAGFDAAATEFRALIAGQGDAATRAEAEQLLASDRAALAARTSAKVWIDQRDERYTAMGLARSIAARITANRGK